METRCRCYQRCRCVADTHATHPPAHTHTQTRSSTHTDTDAHARAATRMPTHTPRIHTTAMFVEMIAPLFPGIFTLLACVGSILKSIVGVGKFVVLLFVVVLVIVVAGLVGVLWSVVSCCCWCWCCCCLVTVWCFVDCCGLCWRLQAFVSCCCCCRRHHHRRRCCSSCFWRCWCGGAYS